MASSARHPGRQDKPWIPLAPGHLRRSGLLDGDGLSGSPAVTGDSGRLPDPDERSPHPGPKLRDLRGLGAAAPLPDAGAFDRRVIAVGGVVFAVLMALSARYGFDRDELYFLDAARHLQASYVDQPVLAPLLAWVSLKLFGVSLLGLRVWSALAAWATVVVAGLTA